MREFFSKIVVSIFIITIVLISHNNPVVYGNQMGNYTSCLTANHLDKSSISNIKVASNFGNPTNKNNIIDRDKFKMLILNMINDDLWYKGKDFSAFQTFEMQHYDMGVYVKNDGSISVVFHNKNKQAYDGDTYFLVKLLSDKRGLLNEYEASIAYSDIKEVTKALKDEGYIFDQTIELSFNKASQPAYPPLTKNKEMILKEARDKVISIMKFTTVKTWKV